MSVCFLVRCFIFINSSKGTYFSLFYARFAVANLKMATQKMHSCEVKPYNLYTLHPSKDAKKIKTVNGVLVKTERF